MRRMIYAVLFCLVLCSVYADPALADEWEAYVPDGEAASLPYYLPPPPVGSASDWGWDDDVELINDLGDGGLSTPSNAASGSPPAVYGSHVPYDGSISSSVVAYMEDVIPRLGNVSYVLFRSSQYGYRLVYADRMECSSGVFTASDAYYVDYNTRTYDWGNGREGTFTLRAGDTLVYSDAVGYPMLHSGSVYWWLIILIGAVFLLFTIYRSWFSPTRMVI